MGCPNCRRMVVGKVTVSWSCPFCEAEWVQGRRLEERRGGRDEETNTREQAIITHTNPSSVHPSTHLTDLVEVYQTPLFASVSGHPDLADPTPPSSSPDPLPRPSFLSSSLSSLASSSMEDSYFHPNNFFHRAVRRSSTSFNPNQTHLLDSLVREFEDMRGVPSLHRLSQVDGRVQGLASARAAEKAMHVKRHKVTVEMEARQDSCPICQEVFHRLEEFVELPCVHVFHWHCIGEWLRAKRSCPMCRVAVDM